jgi:glycosyltransferase involved in cell wall biosynthesis
VENIVKIINNNKLRRQFKNNIRSYVEKDVGWDNVAKSHIKIYQSVVRVPYGRARHVFWE